MTNSPPRIGRRHLMVGAASSLALTTVSGCRDPHSESATESRRDPSLTVNEGALELSVEGDSIQPVIELAEGSEAEVSWFDLDTGSALGVGVSPTLQTAGVHRVGMQATSRGGLAFDEVVTLNLGFSHEDDYGELSLAQEYDHDPQPVTGVAGLQLLTHLRRFCASRTPLKGALDVSGLSMLEHVECYQAGIDGVDLSGCSSLTRLCVEDCRLTELDLNPVRSNLRDLRAAIQRAGGLTFAPLDGPMEALYHYCVRDQPVHEPIPHRHLPVVEEYWAWATGQRACDIPTSPILRSYLARDNPLDQASVDSILVGLHALVTGEPGRVDLSGGSSEGEAAAPSTAGAAAAAALSTSGWRVSTN